MFLVGNKGYGSIGYTLPCVAQRSWTSSFLYIYIYIYIYICLCQRLSRACLVNKEYKFKYAFQGVSSTQRPANDSRFGLSKLNTVNFSDSVVAPCSDQ